MQGVHIFRRKGSETIGYTADRTGSNLPPGNPPWEFEETVRYSPENPPFSEEIMKAVQRGGYYVANIKYAPGPISGRSRTSKP